jgi:C4-type Zn-finger protein
VWQLVCGKFYFEKCVPMKAKIEELETNSKLKNVRDLYRGINDLKKGYQPRTNIVKDEQGDLVVHSHSILARWRNYFSQVLNYTGSMMLGRQKYTQQNY